MPPKKKPRLSSRPPSATPQIDSLQTSANTPVSSTESALKPGTDYDPVTDPWTDEQETALLKGIIKWKPVGMHKHFRMIAISEFMKSQGYASPNAEHTRIPGIWKKLETLYNLQALDEREDSLLTDPSEDLDTSKELYCSFELPEDEYGEMMFERRLAVEGSSVASGQAESRRGSTVADTDELASSPAPSRGRKSTRGTRTRSARSTRLQVEIEARRKESDDDQDSEDGDANEDDDEEDTDAGKEESDGNDEAEEEPEHSPTTRGRPRRSGSKPKKGAGTGVRRTGRRR